MLYFLSGTAMVRAELGDLATSQVAAQEDVERNRRCFGHSFLETRFQLNNSLVLDSVSDRGDPGRATTLLPIRSTESPPTMAAQGRHRRFFSGSQASYRARRRRASSPLPPPTWFRQVPGVARLALRRNA